MKKFVIILGVIFLSETQVFAAQGNNWQRVSYNYQNDSLLRYKSTELVSYLKAGLNWSLTDNGKSDTPSLDKQIYTTTIRFRRQKDDGTPDERGRGASR